ncbi:rhodanese-like domain-containing protein [Bernardetia sp.]|uniref:rhodanese-like domain-containing protein n=1 Tax=Bernardetia sp. TaxID=1937974 RepID=UPI0025B93016|nr:rhodanese-like domain-containing protein [Bernardetia sp.]
MNDITPQELKALKDEGKKINLLDVREPFEYEEYNLDGKLIPLGELPSRLDELEDWKEQEVIVHCKAGGRSANAKAFLMQNGFKNVRNLLQGADGYKKLS